MPDSIVRPPALFEGATLGIVAPASAPELERLERGLAALHERGLRTKVFPHVTCRHRHLAGTDTERLADLHAAFLDPEVDAVLCARGGNGSLRLLPALDFDLIRRHPKPFIGYSDITVLHLAIWQRCRMVTFFAPMPQPDFARGVSADCWEAWWRLLSAPDPVGELTDPRCDSEARTLVGGVAEGPCLGGTLSLLVSLIGTPFQPDLRGAILFLEDVGETPPRIERFLMHLRLAGLLDGVAGFLIGPMLATGEVALPLATLYGDLLAPLGKPLVYDFPIGHTRDPLALPVGARVRLDADRRRVAILEPAVAR